MGFTGLTLTIPMGQGGLRTDDSPTVLQPTDLIVANNVNFHSNLIEKDSGSVRFNTSAISGGVLAVYDWWPTFDVNERKLVVIGGDGKVYSINNLGVVSEITASGGAPATLDISNQFFFLACGRESNTQPRTLFIFNGINPVQVVSGTGVVRTDMSAPNSDWGAGNYPTAAFSHRGAVWAYGVGTNPHVVYRSLFTDHEDFNTTPARYTVYQGEAERLVASILFRGKPFIYKSPFGLYAMDDSDANPVNWFFSRVSGIFGAASPNSPVEALNDILVKTPSDSLLSFAATQQFGDVTASDTLEIMNIAQFIRDNTDPLGSPFTWAIYYAEKKTLYVTYRGSGTTSNTRMLSIRLDVNGKPKAAWITKDAPYCLALRKDTQGIPRPLYGSLDGYVYLMDQTSRNVNNTAYIGEFQTPHMDFGFVDARVSGQLDSKNKLYQYLEMRYYPQGDYPIYVDVSIDGNYTETLQFDQESDDLLADVSPQSNDFMLSDSSTDPDGSFLSGEDVKFLRRKLNGQGRTISFRVYNAGLNQSFKIASLLVAFKAGGNQERTSST